MVGSGLSEAEEGVETWTEAEAEAGCSMEEVEEGRSS